MEMDSRELSLWKDLDLAMSQESRVKSQESRVKSQESITFDS